MRVDQERGGRSLIGKKKRRQEGLGMMRVEERRGGIKERDKKRKRRREIEVEEDEEDDRTGQ